MSNKNLSKTLFADFRKIDTKKLNINVNPFSKIVTDHVPETPTENDIWKYAVTTDDEGIVTVTDDVAVDFSEITDAQKAITQTAAKVIDNKVLKANNSLLMNWDTENFTNSEGSDMSSIFGGSSSPKAPITEWDSDLSSLTNGSYMFQNTSLLSFSGDLSSLTNGRYMFYITALRSFSGDLSNLNIGYSMFVATALESFSGDLSSLTNGGYMFYASALESFSSDLSSLTYGNSMFRRTALESFSGDLSSLTDGRNMFYKTPLESFNGDLSSLTNGTHMFYNTALASFSGDLSSLSNGSGMFRYNQPRHYGVFHLKIVDGRNTWVTETFVSNGLKSFISNLSSLKCGYHMFGSGGNVTYTYTDDNGNEITETTKDITPLDEESIMLIADTINDISSLDKTDDNDWTYITYDYYGNLTTSTLYLYQRGILHLGYDSSITDTTNIFKYCDEIVAKGWTVYLNGSKYTSTDSGSASLTNGESSIAPIPHYYKPVQVTDEEIAEYVDANNNYYIIIGGQHVFGDDLSSYGMFASYEHAVTEITSALGLSVYVKPSEEIIEEKFL